MVATRKTAFLFWKPLNGYFYSEDPDEMPHNGAFYQGLHCLLRIKKIFRQKHTIFFENYNLTTLHNICTMDYPMFIVSNEEEESISIQWVKICHCFKKKHFTSLLPSELLFACCETLHAFLVC